MTRSVLEQITVCAADVGGINSVKPPSMHSLLRNIVAGRGARYLHQNVSPVQRQRREKMGACSKEL